MKTAVRAGSNVDSNIRASKSINQHRRKHDAEKNGGQDTLLLNLFVTRKATELSPLFCTLACMPSNISDEFFGVAVFCLDSPRAVSADCVKCLGQINIGRVEVSVLFLTLLLQQTPCQQSYVHYGSGIDSPARIPVRGGC